MAKQGFLSGAYEPRTSEEMREYYDRWAEVYDAELTENDYQQPRRCAEALVQHLENRDAVRILDAGCGTGLSGLALFEAGFFHIDGCDISNAMLEKAFQTDIYSKLFVADLNKPIDSPDETYDAVTAVGVFSFGHIRADAIDEFLRILKPGAVIVIGMNDHYYREGTVTARLDALASDQSVAILSREHGDHIPGTGLTGWVIVVRKSGREAQ